MNIGSDDLSLIVISVTKNMVEDCVQDILCELKNEDSIDLETKLQKLKPLIIKYNNNEQRKEQFKNLSVKLSQFMAYQEAAHNLMLRGEIIPVSIRNDCSFDSTTIYININSKLSNVEYSGNYPYKITRLVYNTFIKVPSKNKPPH